MIIKILVKISLIHACMSLCLANAVTGPSHLKTIGASSAASSVSSTEYQSTVFSGFPDDAKRTAGDHPETPAAKLPRLSDDPTCVDMFDEDDFRGSKRTTGDHPEMPDAKQARPGPKKSPEMQWLEIRYPEIALSTGSASNTCLSMKEFRPNYKPEATRMSQPVSMAKFSLGLKDVAEIMKPIILHYPEDNLDRICEEIKEYWANCMKNHEKSLFHEYEPEIFQNVFVPLYLYIFCHYAANELFILSIVDFIKNDKKPQMHKLQNYNNEYKTSLYISSCSAPIRDELRKRTSGINMEWIKSLDDAFHPWLETFLVNTEKNEEEWINHMFEWDTPHPTLNETLKNALEDSKLKAIEEMRASLPTPDRQFSHPSELERFYPEENPLFLRTMQS